MLAAACARSVPREPGTPGRGGVTMYLGPVSSPDHASDHSLPRLPGTGTPAARFPQREASTGTPRVMPRPEPRQHVPKLFTKHGANQLPLGSRDSKFSLTPRVQLDSMQDYRVVNSMQSSRKIHMSPLRMIQSPAVGLRARDPTPVSPAPAALHHYPAGQEEAGFGRAERPHDTGTVVKSYTPLDQRKLPRYDWNSAKAPRRPTNVAADKFYTLTYGRGHLSPGGAEGQRSSEAGQLARGATVSGKLARRRAQVLGDQEDDPAVTRPRSMAVTILRTPKPSDPASSQRPGAHTSAGVYSNSRLIDRLSELDDMYDVLDVKPAPGNVNKSRDGHLYSRVQESIEIIKSSPRGNAHKPLPSSASTTSSRTGIRNHRPLKKEQGKYRPLSQTSVRTPSLESPLSAYKDFKSAEAYVKYLDSLKEGPRAKSGFVPRGGSTSGGGGGGVDMSATRLLQSVADHNRPGAPGHHHQERPHTHHPRASRLDARPLGPRTAGRGRRAERTEAGLMAATLQDLIIEPVPVTARGGGGDGDPHAPPPSEAVHPDWAISDFYDEHLLNDYRPPSASSATSDKDKMVINTQLHLSPMIVA